MTSDDTAPEDKGAAASADFASLYDSLAGRLLGAARTLGCAGTEAEDIVHDLFVRLVRSGACLGDVDDPEAYAFTSLRHAVSRSRQRKALERTAIERIGREGEADGRAQAPDEDTTAHGSPDRISGARRRAPRCRNAAGWRSR